MNIKQTYLPTYYGTRVRVHITKLKLIVNHIIEYFITIGTRVESCTSVRHQLHTQKTPRNIVEAMRINSK